MPSRALPIPYRRVIFQIHLWTGLAVGLYAVFIGCTGAVLMFRAPLQARAYPALFAAPPVAVPADPQRVVAALEHAFPGSRFTGIEYPHAGRGTFLAYVATGSELHTVFLDPGDGHVIGELPHDGWIQRLQELHFNFLAGPRGYVFNGVGAASLLVMCLSGIVIWWPGMARLGQALLVHPNRGWRRVTWELHGTVAIWSIVLLVIWCVSGLYFCFPVPLRAAMARVATLTPSASFPSGAPSGAAPPSPALLVQRARLRVPGAQLARFGVPTGEQGAYSVTLATMRHGDGDSSDEVTIYFDRYSGAELGVVSQHARTVGDRVLTWLGRLHVGNFGGTVVPVVWFAGGLIFPLLFSTGVVMWWNRVVRARRARAGTPATAPR